MKTKWNAAVLAIFFGWLWFHRFYLWQWWGLLYIIFMVTLIPFFLSLIEWIYFIFISKKEFDVKYNFEYMKRMKEIDSL